MNPTERRTFIRDLRRVQAEAASTERYRRHAIDMLADGQLEILEPEYLNLDEEERGAYLDDLAESLAKALMHMTALWAIEELPFVAEWRRERCRVHAIPDERRTAGQMPVSP